MYFIQANFICLDAEIAYFDSKRHTLLSPKLPENSNLPYSVVTPIENGQVGLGSGLRWGF
jgi:hypothetical protein